MENAKSTIQRGVRVRSVAESVDLVGMRVLQC